MINKLEKNKKKRDIFSVVFDLLHLDLNVFEISISKKISNKIRFSIHSRLTDLYSIEYMKRKYSVISL